LRGWVRAPCGCRSGGRRGTSNLSRGRRPVLRRFAAWSSTDLPAVQYRPTSAPASESHCKPAGDQLHNDPLRRGARSARFGRAVGVLSWLFVALSPCGTRRPWRTSVRSSSGSPWVPSVCRSAPMPVMRSTLRVISDPGCWRGPPVGETWRCRKRCLAQQLLVDPHRRPAHRGVIGILVGDPLLSDVLIARAGMGPIPEATTEDDVPQGPGTPEGIARRRRRRPASRGRKTTTATPRCGVLYGRDRHLSRLASQVG